VNDKVWMVNLTEHIDGRKPNRDVTLAQALAGQSTDPAVGMFLEFRIVRDPPSPDLSVVPKTLIPNPVIGGVSRRRDFLFNSGAVATTTGSTAGAGPWGIQTDGAAQTLDADYGRISAAPKGNSKELWTLTNKGGWDHPVHIHFEEGQLQLRNGTSTNVPAWEKGRKDVYRLRPAGSVTLAMQFRDWSGTFMEHCHNTVHEDNAMLLRWDLDPLGYSKLNPLPTPIPTPQGVTFVPPDDILPTAY
jgi:FtsP/CotA-like multicopper oxidase with cupredoxin domain